jgi:hypothetical protein
MQSEAFADQGRTWTITSLVFDLASSDAVVIDPVLDLDTAPWRTSTDSVIRLLHLIKAQHWILDTHTCRPCQRCRGAEETPAGCSGYRRQHQGRQPSRTGK